MIYKKVFDKLLKNSLTIGFAESMTGGLCSYKLISFDGASNIIKGSIVAYTNETKSELLGIDIEQIDLYTSVSREISYLMAEAVKVQMNPDVSVSITGNAGLGYENHTFNLEAYITILYQDETYQYRIDLNEQTRIKNIEKTVLWIYQKLDEIIL